MNKYSKKFNQKRFSAMFGETPDVMNDWYGEFLCDGDFELWQPYTEKRVGDLKNKKQTIDYLEARIRALRLFIRSLWIMNRFTEYQSTEWAIWNFFTVQSFTHLRILKGALHNAKTREQNAHKTVKEVKIF